jgi:small-conductance mechanosensitive channel
MGGLSITYMRAFKVGDRVRIGDTVGDVIDKSLLVTHIRTIKNEDITIPNAMIMNTHVVNYSARAKEEGLILHTSVTIGYDAPWRTVHELLIEAARKTACILLEPKPFVLQTALNDFYVTYELNAYTDEPRQMVNTYSALHRNIQDSFNEAGVEIMSPHYAQLRDGNKTAIPDAYLPPGYVPRSHRVVQVPEVPEEPGKAGENR